MGKKEIKMIDSSWKWESDYDYAYNGLKCISNREPSQKKWGTLTEEEAITKYKQGLNNHTAHILIELKQYFKNEALKARLIKYNCTPALDALMKTEYLISQIPYYTP